MSYWASPEDQAFASGHYVEPWELQRLSELAEPVRALLKAERTLGNKIIEITSNFVRLAGPPACGVLALPEGLAFCTPIRHTGSLYWDGEEEGVIFCPQSGDRICPSGLESQSQA